MQRNIPLCFMSRTGRFLGRASGENRGNVLLRKEQYRISDDVRRSLRFGKQFVYAKVHNLKWIIERTIRDHPLQVDTKKLSAVSGHLSNNYNLIKEALTLEELRGIEGETAKLYFSCFNELIPVSYTHLDVYKRQGSNSGSEFSSEQFFASRFNLALNGYKQNVEEHCQIAVMALDAATPGRMAMTFFREYLPNEQDDFFESLGAWHERLAWQNFSYSRKLEKMCIRDRCCLSSWRS